MPNARLMLRMTPVSLRILGIHGTQTMKKPQVISAVAQNTRGARAYRASAALPYLTVTANLKAADTQALHVPVSSCMVSSRYALTVDQVQR